MTMRFYAACLTSYNNGVLHGRWIDADSDVDTMQEEVNDMLRESKFPNVTVTCPECAGEGKPYGFGDSVCEVCKGEGTVPSAEEWAIHDYDGMPTRLGEYPGLQEIANYVELVEQVEDVTSADAEELAEAMLDNWHTVEAAKEAAKVALENFSGVYDSFRDYADELADELMPSDAPDFLSRYFDYAAFARDLEMEHTVLDLPDGRVAIFHD